jgi:hypothetical protein
MSKGTDMPRYLSKSRFKSALECPTKLDYLGKTDYVDTKKSNDFLKALAEGGFQVGELAKLYYPEAVEVTKRLQADQIAKTLDLLSQNDVTIFEATVQFGDWVARIDILKKHGNKIDLIEVKSKSFDSSKGTPHEQWRGQPNPKGSKNPGVIKAEILPYLQDIAFQTMLVQKAFPNWEVTPFLMMPDKAKKTSVSGLNQMFKIFSEGRGDQQRTWAEKIPGTSLDSIGSGVLVTEDVSEFVTEIINGTVKFPGGEGYFSAKAAEWANAYAREERIPAVVGKHCRKCEFYCSSPDNQNKSGFHQCWTEATHATYEEIMAQRPITDLYWPSKGELDKLIAERGVWLSDLMEEDFEGKVNTGGMNRKFRQYMQVFGQWNKSKAFEFDKALWREYATNFTYPLHFIDFEGARPALPFLSGKTPYSQVAFQFSHHVMYKDGSVTHANEFLDITPGNDPTITFIRELKKALCEPGMAQGTVFMWSPYENTMLNGLRSDLIDMKYAGTSPNDVDDLIEFIESLTVRKNRDVVVHHGARAMVDLNKIASQCFFHPDTNGRTSIKVTLPAIMKTSAFLKDLYSNPIYGSAEGVPSKNFPIEGAEGMIWWVPDSDGAKNPYDLLPPIFSDIRQDELEAEAEEEGEDIREGGAATTAYSRMQFTNVSPELREATRKALLRYCELDTLAMVMIYQAWMDWSRE